MKKLIITITVLTVLLSLVGCSKEYKDPQGNKYKYKLELTGTMPNSKKELKLTVLTNNNTLTFDEVTKSLYSSNSKDSKGINFYVLSN